MNEMSFASWATDPSRTVEEKYGALLLVEATARSAYWKKFKILLKCEFYDGPIPRKHRSLDPGYIPEIRREHALWAEEFLAELTYLDIGWMEDRPCRDLSFLRFCPGIESFHLRYSEVFDFSPITSLSGLKELDIFATDASDFTWLDRMETLESLRLTLFHPWPDLRGLERLPGLREIAVNGNSLALGVIPRLPAVRKASIHGHRYNTPVRSLDDLPEMPEIIDLELDSATSLDGLQRFPKLINVHIKGRFHDLTPIRVLTQATHIHLATTACPDVSVLAELPSLCAVRFEMEMPPDLTPLASAPRLHEIFFEGSPIVPAELESLNALCEPWDNEFAAGKPRRLRKPFLRIQQDREIRWKESPAPCRDWKGDRQMYLSEARWFYRRFNKTLDDLLGKEWGHLDERTAVSPGSLSVIINRLDDISRLPEITANIRTLIASARHPWKCILVVDALSRFQENSPGTTWSDDDWLIRENEEMKEKEREHHERLRRAYLHRLSLESGVSVPPAKPDTGDAEIQPEEETTFFFPESPEYDLGTSLRIFATINETHVYVWERCREIAEELFGLITEPDGP